MRNLARVLYALVLLVSTGALVLFVPLGVDTELFSLLGGENDIIHGCGRAIAGEYRVLCDSPEIATEVRSLASFDDPVDPKALYELVRTKGKGLLGWKHRTLLCQDKTNQIARAAMRRDYTGVGIFPKEDDPYYFLNDFVMELGKYHSELEDGMELLTGHSDNPAADHSFLRLIDYAKTHEGVYLSGAPFHTYLATQRSVREMNILGTISIVGVIAFGLMLFRSFRFVVPTVLTLGAGFIIASAAVFVAANHWYFGPGKPHMLTFLFGTSLIGLGVDYCYHRLHHASARKIGAALLTTTLVFVPFIFCSVKILFELSVFTITGLLAIASSNLVFIRSGASAESFTQRKASRFAIVVKILLCLTAAYGLRYRSIKTHPDDFIEMDPFLATSEAKVAEVISTDSVRIRPQNLRVWQEQNAELKAKMGMEAKGEFLTAADLPRGMTYLSNEEEYVILPCDDASGGLSIKAELEGTFGLLTVHTRRLLLDAFAGLLIVLVLVFRLKSLRYVWSVSASLVTTAGVLCWMGESFTFFHFIAFFMILGLGIDYAIFGGGRVVFYSFLTSLVGFGMLGFTSFPPTRMMGTTIALGLFFAWLFAGRTGGGHGVTALPKDKWHERKEQSAGKLRLRLTFALYRYLGKDFCKLCAVFVVASAYPGFRKRCGFKKALSFAFGLLDKLDACTLRKNLPKMTVIGDRGWMKGGCFLLSTHVGTIEVLPALQNVDGIVVHAFQQMTHNKLFTEMFMRHFDKSQFVLHPVEEIGVETACEMQEAIARGEMVLMAGDRDPASGGKKGVFKFAKLMESPVYAITCIRTGWNAYTVNAKELDRKTLQADYEAFLADAVAAHSSENFTF